MKDDRNRRRGRPLKGEAKRERTSFTLPPDQIAWLEHQAKVLGITKSDVLFQVLSQAQYYGSEVANIVSERFPISKKVLARFCRRHHIAKLSLFGSILLDTFTPESDIDVLVEFQKENTPTYFSLVRMEEELSKLLGGRAVDIKTPSELSEYFRDEVRDAAEVMYVA